MNQNNNRKTVKNFINHKNHNKANYTKTQPTYVAAIFVVVCPDSHNPLRDREKVY